MRRSSRETSGGHKPEKHQFDNDEYLKECAIKGESKKNIYGAQKAKQRENRKMNIKAAPSVVQCIR